MGPADLIAFEDEMAREFEAGNIKAPLHLSGGNEQELLDIFADVGEADWVCGTWRAHYHALLKGVPREELKRRILEGRSIGLCFPQYRMICSAIVGGIAPIAVGLAWAIKWRGGHEKVWCFLGDMASETGIVHECMKYVDAHDLPIKWVVEDNGIGGTNVPTRATWQKKILTQESEFERDLKTIYYRYEMTRPFVGIGKHIPL